MVLDNLGCYDSTGFALQTSSEVYWELEGLGLYLVYKCEEVKWSDWRIAPKK